MSSILFRIASSLMIGIGIIYLFMYVFAENMNKAGILNQPSYYQIQNYLCLFVAGTLVIIFSLLGSFFSWFKQFDAEMEPLPNAGYATDNEISTWVKGTSMDVVNEGETLLLRETEISDRATEILPDDGSGIGKTEFLEKEEKE